MEVGVSSPAGLRGEGDGGSGGGCVKYILQLQEARLLLLGGSRGSARKALTADQIGHSPLFPVTGIGVSGARGFNHKREWLEPYHTQVCSSEDS